jgi:hypothetical protein
MADGSVTSAKILDGTITSVDLATGVITSSKIANGAVTTAKIADGAVTSSKLAPGAATRCIVSYNNIGTSSDIPTTPRNLGSVSLSIPANGYVVLTTTATIWTFGDGTRCWFGLGTSAGSINLHETGVGVIDGSGTQRRTYSATSHAVVPVTAGSRTFYATAYKDPTFGAQSINMGDIILTAVYYSA